MLACGDGTREGAVLGNFAYLRTLSAELVGLFDEEKQRVLDGTVTAEESAIRCANGFEGAGTCTFYVSRRRETDPGFTLVLEEGETFGSATFPGFDANVQDPCSMKPTRA